MDNNKCNHVVIMAGGIGSRFWPMSTTEYPKQFIDVIGCGRTLIQLTVDRFKGICPPENVWVVTSEKYATRVKEQLPEVLEDHILLEPCRRNTAPCIAYVGWKIRKRYPDANLVVTPSDHMVIDPQEFRRVVCETLAFTKEQRAIVTLGMKPTRPETGYGYIEAELNQMRVKDIYQVKTFREKPVLEVAEEYIKLPNFYWNAGIFIWNVQTLTWAIRTYCPQIADVFDQLEGDFYTGHEQERVNELFPTCENISVDYAVMEKAKDIFVHPADFGWSDLGTWGSLHTLLHKDEADNVSVGAGVQLIECSGCVVHTSQERRVVLQGLDGYIVAEKNNTLLVCKLDQEQRIKEFIE